MGGYALHPLQGGQIEPLVVIADNLGVDEKSGAFDVARIVEDNEIFVARLELFEGAKTHLAGAGFAVPVAEYHPGLGSPVSPAGVPRIHRFRNGEAFFLERLYFVDGWAGNVSSGQVSRHQEHEGKRQDFVAKAVPAVAAESLGD